jgi:hypothetical protein
MCNIALTVTFLASLVNCRRLAGVDESASRWSSAETSREESQVIDANSHMLEALLFAHNPLSPARLHSRSVGNAPLRPRVALEMQEEQPDEQAEKSTPDATEKSTPVASKKTKRKPTSTGLFAPLVIQAKKTMGEKELQKLRAQVIKEHSKVIANFVDTSESKFGQIVLKRMFEAADKDNSGDLDREEIREALNALGFSFVTEKDMDKLMKRADGDDNEVIDFEEFIKETPRTLRQNLIGLAKENGHDLGFLA